MSLLSPSGGLLLGPMKTPRLSAVLSADMEPQMPSEPHSAGLQAASNTAGSMSSPGTAHAGSKRTYSAARLDDRCTEICENAQGKKPCSMPPGARSADSTGVPAAAVLQPATTLFHISETSCKGHQADCQLLACMSTTGTYMCPKCPSSQSPRLKSFALLVVPCSCGHEQPQPRRRAESGSSAAVAAHH